MLSNYLYLLVSLGSMAQQPLKSEREVLSPTSGPTLERKLVKHRLKSNNELKHGLCDLCKHASHMHFAGVGGAIVK